MTVSNFTHIRTRALRSEMAMKRFAATALLTLTIVFPACGQSMKRPDIKLNPHPKMRYEITLTIEDAPGPFDAVEGSVDYQVSNERCSPLTPISGARPTPTKHVGLALTHIGDKVYKGAFYADLLADEDYFGLGVCRWSLVGVGGSLRIGSVVFSPDLLVADIWTKKPATRYFSALSYHESTPLKQGERPWINIGNPQRSDFKEPKSTFSITLAVEEKFE